MIKIINNQFKCKVCINFPEYYFEKATFEKATQSVWNTSKELFGFKNTKNKYELRVKVYVPLLAVIIINQIIVNTSNLS